MLALHRALDGDLSAGDALPPVYRSLEEAEIRFHRSALHMSVGRPGGGKSIFGLNHAVRARVPTLYVSCDMSRFTLAARTAALLTGDSASDVKQIVKTAQGREKYRAALKGLDHLFLAFEKRPSAEDLEDVLAAFEERWGIPPSLIVIDNMMNLLAGSTNEWEGLRENSHVLDFFADELGAAVHMLHHTNIGGQKLDRPSPIDAVKGKIVELPSLVLSISKTLDELWLAAVKNREGKEDPGARNPHRLLLEPKSMRLSEAPVINSQPPMGQWNTSDPNRYISPPVGTSGPYRGNYGMDRMVND